MPSKDQGSSHETQNEPVEHVRTAEGLAEAIPKMVSATQPGARPIAVPIVKCQSLIRAAPRTMLTTVKGATGSKRMAATVNTHGAPAHG